MVRLGPAGAVSAPAAANAASVAHAASIARIEVRAEIVTFIACLLFLRALHVQAPDVALRGSLRVHRKEVPTATPREAELLRRGHCVRASRRQAAAAQCRDH